MGSGSSRTETEVKNPSQVAMTGALSECDSVTPAATQTRHETINNKSTQSAQTPPKPMQCCAVVSDHISCKMP